MRLQNVHENMNKLLAPLQQVQKNHGNDVDELEAQENTVVEVYE
jgi:hypothetical protein